MHRYRQLIAVALFLALLLLIAEFSGLREHFSLTFLHQKLEDHLLSGLAIFVVLFVFGNLIHIPGWIFLAAAVLAMGKMSGGIATYIAASISCVVTFSIVRYIGGDALRRLDSRIARRFLDHLHAHPLRNIILLRTLFQTLPAINYALALSGVGFRTYLVATLLGLPLPIAAYCVFFDYLAMFLH